VCVSFYTFFCFLAILQVLECTFLICYVFQCFSPYFISYHASFSFSSFVGFLAIFQVLKCEFLLFLFGEFYCYNPGPTVCISHFSRFHFFSPDSKSYSVCVLFSTFFNFLSTIQFLQCEFLIFKVFHCFLPYSMHYSVCFSFHKFFTVSRHISCPTM
jgi:hypothetical protein